MNKVDLFEKVESFLNSTLSKFGYEYLGVEDISTQATPNWMRARFRNEYAARVVDIDYIPPSNSGREVLRCHISDLNFKPDDFDYTSTNQMTVPSVKFSELSSKDDDRMEVVLKSIAQELESNFKDVLLGKRFETEEFDWQGLK